MLACRAVAFSSFASAQQTPIKLWPKGAPAQKERSLRKSFGLIRTESTSSRIFRSPPSFPTFRLQEWPQERQSSWRQAEVIRELWMDHEGYAVGEWLSSHGVAAFVLKYRLAKEDNSKYTVEGTELAICSELSAPCAVAARSGESIRHASGDGVLRGGELAALQARAMTPVHPPQTILLSVRVPSRTFKRFCTQPFPMIPGSLQNTARLPGLRRQRPARHLARLGRTLSCSEPSPRIHRAPHLRRDRPWLWHPQNQSTPVPIGHRSFSNG